MKRLDIALRVRSLTRDLSNSIFREIDVNDYINESINRIRQVIPELRGMVMLTDGQEEPILLPDYYHHILAVYSASRCFAQDERNYQASSLMNEFETKLEELKHSIENGEIVIVDPTGAEVVRTNPVDYVRNDYFVYPNNTFEDDDPGVEGV